MAVINNISAALTSFKINDSDARLIDNTGTYGTQDVLNGGELVDNTLSYSFSVNGLQDHKIGSITISAILLNADGSLATARNIKTQIKDFGNAVTQNFAVSDAQKVIIPITITNRNAIIIFLTMVNILSYISYENMPEFITNIIIT